MTDFTRINKFVSDEMTIVHDMGHAYDHVKRVFSLAMEVGEKLGAELKILGAAALLHDVGRTREAETGISHSISSGEIGHDILVKVGYSQDEIDMVKQVIRTHRFSEGLKPNSLEGQILSDVDKLDAIGAIGIYRAIAHAASIGVGVNGFLQHADEKLLKLKDMMYTDLARQYANERHRFLETFVRQLRTEMS